MDCFSLNQENKPKDRMWATVLDKPEMRLSSSDCKIALILILILWGVAKDEG